MKDRSVDWFGVYMVASLICVTAIVIVGMITGAIK